MQQGIMEIGHIFVVNKMDLPGSFIAMKDIEETLAMSPRGEWKPPVVGVNSLTREGYSELISEIHRHGEFIKTHSDMQIRKFRTELELTIDDELKRRFHEEIVNFLGDSKKLEKLLNEGVDPYSAAENLINRIA